MLQLNEGQKKLITKTMQRLGLQSQIFLAPSDKFTPEQTVFVSLSPKPEHIKKGTVIGRQINGQYLIQLDDNKFCTVSEKMIQLAKD